MNYQHLIPKLNSYGLSVKESTIYLTCLELGSSVAGTIAGKSGENRATVYSILKELIKQQLISQVTRKGVMYFLQHHLKSSPTASNRSYKNFSQSCLIYLV